MRGWMAPSIAAFNKSKSLKEQHRGNDQMYKCEAGWLHLAAINKLKSEKFKGTASWE